MTKRYETLKAPIFDSHAHYTDRQFDADRLELLQTFPSHGIVGVMEAAVDLETARAAIALAEQVPFLVTAIGAHPGELPAEPNYLEQLRELAKHPSVKAVGEIGLDYHYEGYDANLQKRVLREQLELARELDLPVILHCRDAMGDMLALLRDYAPLDGVMHCYSGSAESAKEVLNMGLYLGFTGVVTYKNARKALETLRIVPADRMLIETDCPYLSPVPYRKYHCNSTMLPATAEVMARETDMTAAEVLHHTAENAARLYRIK